MLNSNTMRAWKQYVRTPRAKWTAALLLATLVLIFPIGSAATAVSSADTSSVANNVLMRAATDAMDEKDRIILELEGELDAQRDYYVELLDLKDQRIEILEQTVEDALGNPTKDFLDKLLWGLAGFGVGRLSEQ